MPREPELAGVAGGGCDNVFVGYTTRSLPLDDRSGQISLVGEVLDPVLVPLGFAAAQAGATGTRGQVIFCRGVEGSFDGGCIDLVLDLEAAPEWRIVDVRYWGFPAERWHLEFLRDGELSAQLAGLAESLPQVLG